MCEVNSRMRGMMQPRCAVIGSAQAASQLLHIQLEMLHPSAMAV